MPIRTFGAGGHISIPKVFKPRKKVTVTNGDTTEDITQYVLAGKWEDILLHLGIPSAELAILNFRGKFSNYFTETSEVKIFADNDATPTTLKFTGHVQKPALSFSKTGPFVNLFFDHKMSDPINKLKVTKNHDSKSTSFIIKDLVSSYLPGFTVTNVVTTTDIQSFNWEDKSFIFCILDLVRNSNYHVRIDNDLDFHLFEKGSILNQDEDVVFGNSLISFDHLGITTDRKVERTRFYGRDAEGLLIIASSGSGDESLILRDFSTRTNLEAENKAKEAQETYSTGLQEGIFRSRYIENISSGDKIPFLHNELKVNSDFICSKLRHTFNRLGFFTDVVIENPALDINEVIKERTILEAKLITARNPNDMDHSFNFVFDDESQTSKITGLTIENGSLVLASGFSTGTWQSSIKTFSNNINTTELRIISNDSSSSTFEVCATGNDDDLEEITPDISDSTSLSSTGKRVMLKITLKSDSDNPYPEIKGAALLVKNV